MITISDAAKEKILEFSAGAPEGWGLRFSVKGGGCSGLQYVMDVETPEELSPKDRVYEVNGVRVFIDMKSALYLAGVTIDYVNGLMQSGFHIDNPNSRTTCGCGQSFH